MDAALPVPLPWTSGGILLAVAATASIYDIVSRRIPNWLCLTGFGAGLAANLILAGTGGMANSAKGCGLAFLVYFPLFLLRGVGGGDVKLMAALGAIAGPGYWLWIFLIASVFGAVCGLALAGVKGRLRPLLANAGRLVWELAHFRPPFRRHKELDVEHEAALRLPHGAVIGMAVAAMAILTRLR